MVLVFWEHTINIDHQLQKKSKIGYYIQETKTTSGTRKIPMTADVEECFRKIIEKRNPPKAEHMVDGKSGFLYFDKNESICYSLHWEHYFQHIIQKYNNRPSTIHSFPKNEFRIILEICVCELRSFSSYSSPPGDKICIPS